MDDISRHNKERWEDLARNNVEWSRPMLDLTAETARQAVDPRGVLGELRSKDVLALAGGGGQQSVSFAMLGAHVTVLDFAETQIERDRVALAHHGLAARLEQGDMRDLSRFADGSFDVVWHAYSINFVPDSAPVFDEVTRVLRPGGVYRIEWHNPFYSGLSEEEWNGAGYTIGQQPYADAEVTWHDAGWDITDADGTVRRVQGPRAFNHTLSTVMNGLIGRGYQILRVDESIGTDRDAAPGSWEHFVVHAPPWLTLWARRAG
jgi:SAM-dependent methyltransferase